VIGSGYRLLLYCKAGVSEHLLRDGAEAIIGRAPECAVSVQDPSVSRRHATVRLMSGELEFIDLGSRNGSLLDGVRVVSNVALSIRPTSVVRLGSAVLTFESAPSARSKQWYFERGVFDVATQALLVAATAREKRAGVIEVRWSAATPGTTTVDLSPPPEIERVFARIVGAQGLIGAYDGGQLLLFLPETDVDHLDHCAALVERICQQNGLSVEIRAASSASASSVEALLSESISKRGGSLVPPVIFQGVLGSVESLLSKLDASDAPVLVVGETGVGKDVLARAIHARSRRAQGPFLALNCAAFTEALFESELFGHERGAFTGAAQAKMGLLESAQGGTVFLDEIGELPLSMQAKLLRVIEGREVFRIGALNSKSIDVRFLFATNRDLHREIESQRFRSDLFFRLSSITLTIPPLRERIDEIVPLSEHFAAQSSQRLGRPPPILLDEARHFLESHSWPGNVRELKNVIELAVLVSDGVALKPSDIHIARYTPLDPNPAPPITEESLPEDDTAPPTKRSLDELTDDERNERSRILDALERSAWNQSAAARFLGMPRRTFVKRLTKYDLPRPRKR
jgi:two-component system, NtrC family, response regulator AtoC